MMLFHKCRQFFRAIRWHREVRQAVSTKLAMLANPSLFAMGGLTDDEEQALCAIASEAAKLPGPIVEFGTLFGITARLLASRAGPEQRVVTIDNFSWNPFGLPRALHEAFARKVLRTELESGRVGLTVAASADFRRGYAGPTPAMVFFDADHSYAAVRDEIAWAKGIGVPFIAGHDYGNAQFGVTRAVDEAFPEGVAVTGSLWCRSRSHAGTHG